MRFQEHENGLEYIARLMLPLPNGLQIWTISARGSNLTDDVMKIEKFPSVALRQAPQSQMAPLIWGGGSSFFLVLGDEYVEADPVETSANPSLILAESASIELL